MGKIFLSFTIVLYIVSIDVNAQEPENSRDRIRWYLLVSPLLIILLGVIICCAVCKNVPRKQRRGAPENPLLSPNPDFVSINIQPEYSSSAGIPQEGESEVTTAIPNQTSSEEKIENTLQDVQMMRTVEEKELVTGTRSRTTSNEDVSPSEKNVEKFQKTERYPVTESSDDQEYTCMDGGSSRWTVSAGHNTGHGSCSESEVTTAIPNQTSSEEKIENTLQDVQMMRTVEEKELVTGTRSRTTSNEDVSPSEKNVEKFQKTERYPVTESSDDQEYTCMDGGSSRWTVSAGHNTGHGSCSESEVTTAIPNQTSSKEKIENTLQDVQMIRTIEEKELVTRTRSRTTSSENVSPSELLERTFLKKLMALDISARNTIQDDELIEETNFDLHKEEIFGESDMKSPESSNPLDVLCGLLHHLDMILQQQIVSKMSMCQFAVPLLLPSPDRRDCTFMLWTMRDIVKRWRPHSFTQSKDYKEDSIVNVPMPVFSFVRLGTCNISKSRYVNQVLSPSQLNHNFFVHSDMPGGNIPRKCSDGLVEISWYLPAGREQFDVFPDPIAVMNLRGDLTTHQEQFRFLISVSSSIFIFIEDINENQHNLLSSLQNKTNVFIILNVRDGNVNTENREKLNKLLPRQNLLVKNKQVNDSQVVKKIRSAMKVISPKIKETLNLEQMAQKATELNIHVDEKSPECQETKAKAKEITDEINNVNDYKEKTMKLQGDLWKQTSKTEKEICRMREIGQRDAEEYKSELQAKIIQLQELQRRHSLTCGMQRFREALTLDSLWERKLFLKWLKILLDTKGRNHLRELHEEYKHKYKRLSTTEDDLKKIDQKISGGSLGVEHFIRELGQFYEIQSKSKDKFTDLPRIAADLLLDGFPLELIDGDASNIPLQWITDVLTELDKKTGGQCRIRVITVLGVQSTGKSTLLNTMFGLQFPVASGRCTRGAFMTLIDAKNLQEELNCDFILVIDTEGLKSLELVSLENSYEHDNELATVVVGLSDITIVNMAMENAEEMKDILQIVVHAFLRMKEIGKKSSCQFVHQNVSDVSAHVKNRNAREKFHKQLSEMAKVAARMEKRSGINDFSDIIYCDIEKDSWYVPGLWYGIPPMASVNSGYSETVSELKKSILRSLQSMAGKPQNITEFTEWTKSLWNAVKHEKFVFSFRNRLVTEAYNQLCIHYADWEWTFQKNVHRWMMETENSIYNLPYEKLGADLWNKYKNDLNQILDKEERVLTQSLEEYFENDFENAHLLEMFQGDFFRSVKYLRKQLESVLHDKCEKTIRIQREKSQIQAMQAQYIDKMEEKVAEMIERRRNVKHMGNDDSLNVEFGKMWEETVSILKLTKLEKRQVSNEILLQLEMDIDCDDSMLAEWPHNIEKYKDSIKFEWKNEHLSSYSPENDKLLHYLTTSVIDECGKYVEELTSDWNDFNDFYSQGLLSLINKLLKRNFQNLRITKLFKIDLKLYILGCAAFKFQKMHDNFLQRNDPRTFLEMLKPQYYSIFKNMFEKRDECRRKAEQFCELCLKPAITDHINKYLGKELMDDILQTSGPEFKSRKHLQFVILEKLLKDNSVDDYVKYINDYERFVQRWISSHIKERYKDQGPVRALQEKTLQTLMAKLRQTLNQPTLISSPKLKEFLVQFCNILEKELVISKNDMKVILFQSNLNVKQFAQDVHSHLHYLQEKVQQEMNSMSLESILSQLTLKPQEEIFKKVIGCGKQCPFCKAPCEAGGADHKEHFASLHRPRGLGQHVDDQTRALDHSICSTNVISNKSFSNKDTDWKPHPYKDYRTHYPDWAIYPDMAATASDYWKFVFREFNNTFSGIYNTKPAKIPEDWNRITRQQALISLRTTLQ